jgi:hypothetical protein
MANSSFYNMVVPGSKNGGNAAMLNAIDSAKLPFCFAPKLVYEQTITWKDLRDATSVVQTDVMTIVDDSTTPGVYAVSFTDVRTGALITTVEHTVHEDTVTVGGTASDGNYDVIFTALDPPVRARVTRATTPSSNTDIASALGDAITDLIATSLSGIVASADNSGAVLTIVYEAGIDPQTLDVAETTATGTLTVSISEDQDAIAAALEALIETARATTLADYVDDESVATDEITVEYVDGVQVRLEADFPGAATGAVVTTNVATITLGSAGNYFPANVWVDGAIANVSTLFDEGGSPTITLEVGDANDPNGLMTASDLTTAGVCETTGAAEFTQHMETAFAPIVTVTGDILFGDLTQGEVSVMVRYIPPPTI